MSPKSRLEILSEQSGKLDRESVAYARLDQLFDEGSFVELDAFAKAGCESAGVVTGYGMVNGGSVFAFSQDSSVAGGAVSAATGAKIAKVYEMAAKMGVPVVGIYDSKGACIAENSEVLAAYGEMLQRSAALSGVVPQIAVIAGVCAGTSALMAANADLVIMAKDAEFFLTAPFVSSAAGDKVEGAGKAEAAVRSGVVQLVAEDDMAAVEEAKKIVSMLPLNNLSEAPYCEYDEPAAAEKLRAACEDLSSYDAKEVIESIFDEGNVTFLENAPNAVTALATLAGQAVGVVATVGGDQRLCKGASARIARFVSICDSFAIPVITLLNCKGFKESSSDELAGGIRDAARLAHVYAEATCPKIAVITGEAYGAAYVALAGKNASADLTVAWPSAVISTLAPEAAVNILYGEEIKAAADPVAERAARVQAYIDTTASAFEAAAKGHVDCVIDPAETRATLIRAAEMLAGKRVAKLPKKHGNMPL